MSDAHEEHHEQPSGEPGGAGHPGAGGYGEQYAAPVWPPPPASADPYAPGGGYASAAGPYSPGGAGADERGGWGAQSGAWSGGAQSPGGYQDPWGAGGAAGPPPGGGWSGGWGGGWQPPPPRPPRRPWGTSRVLGAIAAGLIILAAAAAGVGIGHGLWTSRASNAFSQSSPGRYYGGSPFFNGNSGSGNSGNSGSGSATGQGGPSNASAIAAKVSPALVDVNSTFTYQQARGAGTGVVLTSNGEVLTNNHVVDGATSISVTDVGNHKTYSASVVGYDSTHDIAILQLQNASGLTAANIGNSSKVSVGQPVVAVGNAGGTGGTPSNAGGSVTALNQAITASDELDGSQEHLSGLIETNAKIQSGDSGGSLVNTSAQVIGIDTAGATGYTFQNSSGQGYAIPINEATDLAKQIEAGKGSSTVHVGPTAFLGVMIQSSSSGQSPSNGGFGNGNSGVGNSGGSGNSGSGNSGSGSGNSGSGTSGATISSVVSGGAAQKAGLGAGDTITSFDGHSVSSPTDLTKLIVPLHPGDKVPVAWTDSSGQSHTGTVTMGSGPAA
jgi:S1-C subfamily serine protease